MKIRTIGFLILCLLFTAWFVRNTKIDLPLIFEKTIHGHDELSNSAVAANTTRKFFPPMVRINPLEEKPGNWMEGPFWQHIPPLFAYVPYIFFQLDGQVTIEVKRLSFAVLVLLTGLLFIAVVYLFSKNLATAFLATIAAIFWVNTPFTHELVTGYAFGVSDIVLAFTSVGAFGGLLWYWNFEKFTRLQYPIRKVCAIAALVSLPIMAKNLLGAIPAAIFFVTLLWDYKKFGKMFWLSSLSFLGLLAIYYIPQYFSSPETFSRELGIAFFHAKNYEGWGRPFYYYLTDYLPNRYLFKFTWIYYLGLILTALTWKFAKMDRKLKILLVLSLGWFLWNLIAVSLIESKIPNFIYQSYLFSLFAVLLIFAPLTNKLLEKLISLNLVKKIMPVALLISVLGTGLAASKLFDAFKFSRAWAYNYSSKLEQFYQVGESMRLAGVDQRDLTIVKVSDNDCWARYYIIFLTGAESKTLLEMYFLNPTNEDITAKYRKIYLVDSFGYEQIKFDQLAQYISSQQPQLLSEIERIKKDKSSCQWLVPDEILNSE
ncbi:MAG: hypothetical protein A3B10_02045 [Candidatus Doudnabacteria bacterium RIFCSPLOWO2_01_FULL_44_21]|uniref:Glycosyltransferase RgtA/B/C/D-like domain-containing protein n=1 Tax=Candidatus Doudnabacteria bacterium RIFCSPLOWO2_01_FULL_44_21 TaxID=1817841 RepID=A0A1F5Q5G2_9BACT|nr:MAG: hypothetical protein A3B95_00155 [Candidatus Doudnabacteria bacterium RIFCSPHIGHO2_02_FULL_43_13b]OGE97357.1 MAG: hypothetical protein A3B10_02045 [Candidatus Doudnabacteria bacterium RIFCSPLOWO2_01_FULL_44_21]